MLEDARREGLRAAARVAMALTALGCGGEARRSADGSIVEVAPPSPPAAGSTNVIVAVAPRDCESVVADAFPIPSDYPAKAPVVGPEVVRCCEEMVLQVGNGFPAAWDCCALDEKRGDSRYLRACTPWGPPMPQRMTKPHGAEAEVQGARRGTRGARLDLRDAAAARAARLAGLREVARELPQDVRAAAIATWRARMVAEHGSSRVFMQLAAQLAGAGEADAAAEAAAFAAEEIEHGASCGAVVEALGGEAIDDALPEETLPLHEDATSQLEAALRNVLSVACLAETVAVALIGAERAAMPEGPLRELLTKIWADEIGHARFAWRLLDLR